MESDVAARAYGSDRQTSQVIARSLFARIQPAQILKVVVDRAGDHRIVGIILSGVKFHTPLDRRSFTDEVLSLVEQSFAAAPVEEVDIRAVVPISLGRGTVVSGDNAVPVFRDVFTLSALRPESSAALRRRVDHGIGVFWEPWFLHRQLRW
jgi:hypothetical protein